MTRFLTIGLILPALAVALVGCNSNLKEENALLLEENSELQDQLATRNQALDAANTERQNQAMTISDQRRRIDDLQSQANQPPVNMGQTRSMPQIEGVQWSQTPGEVTATIASDLLFASGQSSLKSSAKQSLNSVASLLQGEYGGEDIRIEGHTDTDPIKKSGYKSNYHLGFERAMSVRTYLESQGIAGDRMVIASHGPDEPKGSKSQSRRVEIVVVMDGG